jgi:mannose-6-phosphate isomerase-like protein (cupin superfamily)
MTHSIPEAPVAVPFDLGATPLLDAGHSRLCLARGERMMSHVMVITEGGEINFHAHHNEEHIHFVLAGEACFDFLPPQESMTLGPLQGILIPADCFYRFRSVGQGNLVLFRMGTTPGPDTRRVGLDGQPLRGGSGESGWRPAVPEAGGRLLRDVLTPAALFRSHDPSGAI